jgi:hypothetical protein
MQVDQYVIQVQTQLAAAAALGDDATRATADTLAAAAEPAVRLALLGAVSAAANEITAALLDSPTAPVVAVRIEGDDLRVDVRPSEPDEREVQVAVGAPDDSDNTSRISLRLPEPLKGRIEAAARSDGVSVNTWILQTASNGLSGSGRRGRRTPAWEAGNGQRLTGWING